MTAFSEPIVPGFAHAYEGEPLAESMSAFQKVEVYDHPTFGRLLMLDGLVQTTTGDEFVYHEMLVHIPLIAHPAPRSVLVIGGGDGGTLRHVLMHGVERAVMVEIDQAVTDACLKWMPEIAGGALDDPRAEVRFDDGIAYVRDSTEMFDAIIIDSSDPVGPGEGLFTEDFYRNAAARLNPGGVLSAQTGTPYYQQGELSRAYRNASAAFDDVRVYTANVPTYPGSLWSFMLAGTELDVTVESAGARAADRGFIAKYWAPELQTGAFALPAIVRAVITGEPPKQWGTIVGQE